MSRCCTTLYTKLHYRLRHGATEPRVVTGTSRVADVSTHRPSFTSASWSRSSCAVASRTRDEKRATEQRRLRPECPRDAPSEQQPEDRQGRLEPAEDEADADPDPGTDPLTSIPIAAAKSPSPTAVATSSSSTTGPTCDPDRAVIGTVRSVGWPVDAQETGDRRGPSVLGMVTVLAVRPRATTTCAAASWSPALRVHAKHWASTSVVRPLPHYHAVAPSGNHRSASCRLIATRGPEGCQSGRMDRS